MATTVSILTWNITPRTGGLGSQCDVTDDYQLNVDPMDAHDALAKFLRDHLATSPGVTGNRIISPSDGTVYDGATWQNVTGTATVELWGEDRGREADIDSDDLLEGGLDSHPNSR